MMSRSDLERPAAVKSPVTVPDPEGMSIEDGLALRERGFGSRLPGDWVKADPYSGAMSRNGRLYLRSQKIGGEAIGSQAIGAKAVGTLAVGAIALGALAIGASRSRTSPSGVLEFGASSSGPRVRRSGCAQTAHHR
jgi:hypothetical protein